MPIGPHSRFGQKSLVSVETAFGGEGEAGVFELDKTHWSPSISGVISETVDCLLFIMKKEVRSSEPLLLIEMVGRRFTCYLHHSGGKMVVFVMRNCR